MLVWLDYTEFVSLAAPGFLRFMTPGKLELTRIFRSLQLTQPLDLAMPSMVGQSSALLLTARILRP